MVVLGVDPGLNATGVGVILADGERWSVVHAGELRPPKGTLPERLEFIHSGLTKLIRQAKPATMVLESVFTHERYLNTAAKMAHARGVACLCAQEQGLALAEYPPARIKKAVTGNGNASKDQVARMMTQWLGRLDAGLSSDATDALALAVAHVHMAAQRQRLAGVLK